MNSRTFAVIGAFLCLIFTANLFAQINLKATIKGRIIKGQSRGIRNAQVTVTNLITLETQTHLTNDFGNFEFDNLPFGNLYYVTVRTRKSENISPYAAFQLLVPVSELTIVGN